VSEYASGEIFSITYWRAEMFVGLSAGDWNRTAEHGEYSHYSVFIMFRHLALHDFFHAYRIEELLLKKEWSVIR
jgi:hypothetical protein